jgi:hypothetical protein
MPAAGSASSGHFQSRLILLPARVHPIWHLAISRYHFGRFKQSIKKKVHQDKPLPVENTLSRAIPARTGPPKAQAMRPLKALPAGVRPLPPGRSERVVEKLKPSPLPAN